MCSVRETAVKTELNGSAQAEQVASMTVRLYIFFPNLEDWDQCGHSEMQV